MSETQRQFLTPAELPALKIHFTNAHRLALEKEGRFPQRIHLGHRTIVYDTAEIQDWLDARAAERYAVKDPAEKALAIKFAAELISARRDCPNAIIDFPGGVAVHWRRDIGPAIDIRIAEGPWQFHIVTVMIDGWVPYCGKDEFDPEAQRDVIYKISDQLDSANARMAAMPRSRNRTTLTARIAADEWEKIRELLCIADKQLDKAMPLTDAPAWKPPPLDKPAHVWSYRIRVKSE